MRRRTGQGLIFALLVGFVAVIAAFALQRAAAPPTRPLAVLPPHSPPAATGSQALRGTPVPLPSDRSAAGLPTETPWPPTPISESQPGRLPTPDDQPQLAGLPADRWRIWLPYQRSATDAPAFQLLAPDAQDKRRWQFGPAIDLGLRSEFPGPSLHRLHPSPDRRLVVADLAYGEQVYPLVIDLKQGRVYTLPGEQAYFYAWHPDSRRVLVSAVEGWLLVDVMSQRYERLTQFDATSEPLPLRALAYSPNGQSLADAAVYAPTITETVARIEVGLWQAGRRRLLFSLPGGSMLAEHSLRWSPDGRWLAFIADVHQNGRQTQLWTIDMRTGNAEMRGMLAQESQYNHPPAWSPDSSTIAAIAQPSDGEASIAIFDVRNSDRRNIQLRSTGAPAHLVWSMDGRWLMFSLARGGFGEAWVSSADGARQQAIAGALPAGAPFAFVEGHE